jgi:hypothetical protein
MRYLRHKDDGTIYEWNPILARDPICEEVTEAEAFPERAPTAPTQAIKPAAKKKPANKVSQFTEDDLREEASRGMP